MKYEYKREFVPRYYNTTSDVMKLQSPERDALTVMGEEGWLLCAMSEEDSGGTKIMYFVREINED